MKALKDTLITQNFCKGIFDEYKYDIAEKTDYVEWLTDVAVTAVTNVLKARKSKEKPVAFVFREADNSFIIAAVVQFFESEDKTEAGNWNYSWTFYEDDIPEDAIILDQYDGNFEQIFATAAHKYKMVFKIYIQQINTFKYLFRIIKNWLMSNNGSEDDFGVFVSGVIQFRSVAENDEIVLSAEPDGEIKQLIKDDKSIEPQ